MDSRIVSPWYKQVESMDSLNPEQASDGLDVHEPAEAAALHLLLGAPRQAAPEIGIITPWYKYVE